jgi:hypothetical protein
VSVPGLPEGRDCCGQCGMPRAGHLPRAGDCESRPREAARLVRQIIAVLAVLALLAMLASACGRTTGARCPQAAWSADGCG